MFSKAPAVLGPTSQVRVSMPYTDVSSLLSADYPALYRPSKGYVFVVTYGRTGSTLTQNLLNAIPGWCIRGENGNVLNNLLKTVHFMRTEGNYVRRRAWRDAGSPAKRNPHGFASPIDPWYGTERVDHDAYALDLLEVFVDRVLNLPDGVRVGGFKEILYYNDPKFLPTQMDLMQELFPGAKILFQTRDHAQVLQSGWWKTRDPVEVRTRLRVMDRLFEEYAQTHSKCFVLDYSSYLAGPEALRPLFDFLDEAFDQPRIEAVLDQRLHHMK